MNAATSMAETPAAAAAWLPASRILGRWLLTPWVAARRSMRWIIGVFMLLSVLTAVALAAFHATGIDATSVVYVLCPVVGLMWVVFVPNMLALGIQAKRLRLPGIRRDIIASACVYALLTTLVPALLLACFGAPFLTCTLILALTASGALLWATLPWFLAFGMCFAPMLANMLHMTRHIHLAAPGEPGFGAWAALVVAILVLLDTLRWSRLMARADMHLYFAMRPMVFGVSQNFATIAQRWQSSPTGRAGRMDPTQLLRQRPDWLQRQPDLRQTGPQFPQRALRVALGGAYLPQTWRSRLYQLLPALPFLLIAVVAELARAHQTPVWSRLWHLHSAPLAEWFIAFVCIIAVAATCSSIQQAWNKVNAELPLLALLPGLGDGTRSKRELLNAALIGPLAALALAAIVIFALALASHQSAMVMLLALLAPLGCAAFAIATVPGIFAGEGQTLSARVMVAVVLSILFVLVLVGTLVPGLSFHSMSAHTRLQVSLGLLTLWLVFAIGVAYIGQRGWRALTRRPHPFLIS